MGVKKNKNVKKKTTTKKATKKLTIKEVYVMSKLPEYQKNIYSVNDACQRKRTPSEVRRLLKSRKTNIKFLPAQEAFNNLIKVFREGTEFDEFMHAIHMFNGALKFQGDLQMSIVFAEHLMKDKSDKELEREVLMCEL